MKRTREQVIWDFVQSWLRKAEGDLRASEHSRADLSIKEELASAAMLTAFGVQFRYPGEEIADVETAKLAFQQAKIVQSSIVKRLQDYLAQGQLAKPAQR